MKRLLIISLALTLLLLAGWAGWRWYQGNLDPEVTTIATTTQATTTEAPTTTEPQTPDAKPFTKDDIAAIEAQFKTVGDYVKAVPAAWYEVDVWWAVNTEVVIRFYDHKPEEGSRPFLYLMSQDDVPGYTDAYDSDWNYIGEFEWLVQELPKALLDAQKVSIHRIDFAKTGDAITPPRGIKVGDSAQKIFENYPDYRSGSSKVLYDIINLYLRPSRSGVYGTEKA